MSTNQLLNSTRIHQNVHFQARNKSKSCRKYNNHNKQFLNLKFTTQRLNLMIQFMEFRGKEPIYLQIAEQICEQILINNWEPGHKIISIRQLSTSAKVNPNTIMRSYEFLSKKDIITNRRGIGYFLAEQSHANIINLKKQRFLNILLPEFLREMRLLNISISEIQEIMKLPT